MWGGFVKSCFFIGHRETSAEVFSALEKAIERHITEYGVTEFIVGHYGGFDRMATKAVTEAKKRHPQIVLSLLTPYHPAERPIVPEPGIDRVFYPPGMERVPRRFAIVRANRYTVDHADHIIACVWYPTGSAWKLVEYARKRERRGLSAVTLLPRDRPADPDDPDRGASP